MAITSSQVSMAPARDQEDVWKYPRPPLLQRTPNRLRVIWKANDGSETVIADTTEAYRVLETSHPPTYYLPPSSVKVPLKKTPRSTFCEWKGNATYHSIQLDSMAKPIDNRIWSYEKPTPAFTPIKDHLSFYASSGQHKAGAGGDWHCFVDDEEVVAQQGDFYGGWVTRNISSGDVGKMKGGPGTWGW